MPLFRNLILVLTVAILASVSAALEIPVETPIAIGTSSLTECWNALLELRSCTNEITFFFMNGESYLGLECCKAVRVITHQCWPSMLTSLGFTVQEGDILQGFCDFETAAPLPEPYGSAPPAFQ